jgi:hypothetical protein
VNFNFQALIEFCFIIGGDTTIYKVMAKIFDKHQALDSLLKEKQSSFKGKHRYEVTYYSVMSNTFVSFFIQHVFIESRQEDQEHATLKTLCKGNEALIRFMLQKMNQFLCDKVDCIVDEREQEHYYAFSKIVFQEITKPHVKSAAVKEEVKGKKIFTIFLECFVLLLQKIGKSTDVLWEIMKQFKNTKGMT